MNLIAKGVEGRVKTRGLEVYTKNMSYPPRADLIDVLAPRIARIFSDLGKASACIHKKERTGT
jgi:hypothetical protein